MTAIKSITSTPPPRKTPLLHYRPVITVFIEYYKCFGSPQLQSEAPSRALCSRSVLSKHLFPLRLLLSFLPFHPRHLLVEQSLSSRFSCAVLVLFLPLYLSLLVHHLLRNHYLTLLCTLSIPTYAPTSTSLLYLLHFDFIKSFLPFTLQL